MEEQESTTIERLLKKMDGSPGFAALGAAVQIISRLGDDVDCDTREVAAAILHDAALTAKLLSIANSSRYARGGHNVTTIDQVLAILGLSTVKSVALSLALLKSLPHMPQSKQLHAEIIAANFCGSLAYEITRLKGSRFSAQEAQICGLMQNLGRMMSIYFLYEDIERSHILQAEQNLSESEAVTQTLGVSFEMIGAAIARHWELPDVLQNSLAPDPGEAPIHAVTNAMVWIQQCSSFCRRVTETLFRHPESSERIEITNVIAVFHETLHLNEKDVQVWIEKCLLETDTLFAEMSFPCNVEQARSLLRKGSERALDMISSQDSLVKVGNLDRDQAPIESIKQVLRLIHAHYSFDHTLICLPIGLSGLVAIAGVGRNAVQVTAKFRSSGIKPDIFREIITRNADTFISDVSSPEYARLIPEWYHEVVGAKSFVMLPLAKEGKLLGMVYGDYSEPHAIAPSGLAKGSMLEWRNLLIHALQSGTKKTSGSQ
jgi:HD-like signal output (HDOD) protein